MDQENNTENYDRKDNNKIACVQVWGSFVGSSLYVIF